MDAHTESLIKIRLEEIRISLIRCEIIIEEQQLDLDNTKAYDKRLKEEKEALESKLGIPFKED